MNKDSTTAAALGLTNDTAALDPGPTSHAQWGAIAAGSLAGFGATIIMATLGLAIGATTGAAAADETGSMPNMGDVTTKVGVAVAIWTLLSALVVGFVGGAVLNRMARYDRPYMPTAFGALTWAGGIVIALLVGASQGTGMMAGAASGAAAGAGYERKVAPADRDRSIPRAEGRERDPREASGQEPAPRPDDGTRREAAKKAATGTAAAAWTLLGAQLVALAATVLAARWRKAREIPVKAGTRIG
jgi:hypothetical protein